VKRPRGGSREELPRPSRMPRKPYWLSGIPGRHLPGSEQPELHWRLSTEPAAWDRRAKQYHANIKITIRMSRVYIGSWNSPQAAMTARGPGTRKAPGDDCLCGKGVICRAYSPIHGWFLGCTQFRVTGCRHAWTIDGRRLPRN
jgi:hypothetical protein